MELLTVEGFDGSAAEIAADIESLDVVAQVGDGADALYEGLLDMRTTAGQIVRRPCFISETLGKLYLHADVLQEVSASPADLEARERASDMAMPVEDAAQAEYHERVEAYLRAQQPFYIYCAEDPTAFLLCTSIEWTREGDREPISGENSWRFTAGLVVDSIDCGTHFVIIQEVAGEYYLYLPQASLEQIRGALPEESPMPATDATGLEQEPDGTQREPEFDYGAIEMYLQRQSPIDVYAVGDSSVYRTYNAVSWAEPSTRRPTEGGWVIDTSLTVNDTPIGERELTVIASGSDYRLCLEVEVLDEIDTQVVAAAAGSAEG